MTSGSWPYLPEQCPACFYFQPSIAAIHRRLGYEILGFCRHPRIGMELFRPQKLDLSRADPCPLFVRRPARTPGHRLERDVLISPDVARRYDPLPESAGRSARLITCIGAATVAPACSFAPAGPPEPRYLLALRSRWVDEPASWGIPGGAIQRRRVARGGRPPGDGRGDR